MIISGRLALLLANCILVAACGASAAPVQVADASGAGSAQQAAATAAPTETPVMTATPEAVLADLTVEGSLAATAADLAAALGVEPQRVRVRIQTSTCTVCKVQEDAELHSIQGLSLEDAAKRIVPGDGFFLFVGRFTCYYRFDGAAYTPRTCQYAPV